MNNKSAKKELLNQRYSNAKSWKWECKKGLWFNKYYKHIPNGVSFSEACSLSNISFQNN